MKLGYSILAALAVLGQTAVAGVAGAAAAANAAGDLPKEIIIINFICTWHFQCYKQCRSKGYEYGKCASPGQAK
ncbi:hypothetical protein FQN49_005567 [Arthroderma sp. PD_2]|nr:hypothetical protein FQN49_005567 [Arthroderma sp. PD_2]